MDLTEALMDLAEEVVLAARALYGDRLVSIVVFGSVACGTPRVDSDLDLLVVADPLPRGRTRRVAEFDPVEAALATSLAALARVGVHTTLSPIFKTPEEVRAGSPLFLDMTLKAKILVDRDEFFAAYLDGLRGRMAALGSRLVETDGGYYWLLKPDWKPGEVIEL